jgi:hypothetical protein
VALVSIRNICHTPAAHQIGYYHPVWIFLL